MRECALITPPPGGYFAVLIGWVSFAALSEEDLGAPGWAKVEAFGGRWVCQGEAGVRSLGMSHLGAAA